MRDSRLEEMLSKPFKGYHYWIYLNDKKGNCSFHKDYFLPGLIDEEILKHTLALYLDQEVGLCADCHDMCSHCHVIGEDGTKYCPILFYDLIKPSWRLEDIN